MTREAATLFWSMVVVLGGGSAIVAPRILRHLRAPIVASGGAAGLVLLALLVLPHLYGWASWLELGVLLALAGTTLGAMWSAILRVAAIAVRRSGAETPRWATPVRTSVRARGVRVHVDLGGLVIAGAVIGLEAELVSLFVWREGLPAAAVVAAVLTTCFSSPAHEAGHLVIARRAGWRVVHMWIGAVNYVRFDHSNVPTPTTTVIAVNAAGPLAGALTGVLAATLWLAVAGPLSAGVALGVGVGLSGVAQLLLGGDAIGVWGGLRLLRRGVGVVVLDPLQGMRPATEVELAA